MESSPFGVYFVMSLLPLAKDTNGVVCPTPSTWIGSITLHTGGRVSVSNQAVGFL